MYNKYIMTDSIILGVMDRNSWNARTDILILINPEKKIIEWIPRDLYSSTINNRINMAYSKGQEELLLKCLNDLNIFAKYCICVLPLCFDENIKKIDNIDVPVTNNMSFYYPLHRHEEIEKGKKIINFNPPFENLKDDRFHEWIGARYIINNVNVIPYPDFDRIRRQQILLKCLLNIKYNFIYSEDNVKGINDEVLILLKKIDDTWIIKEIKESNYIPQKIKGMSVLTINNKNVDNTLKYN
jgi:hypothetical protein